MDWGKVPSSFVKLRERPTWTPPTSTSKNSLKVEPMEFDDHLLDSAVDDDVGGTNEHVVNVGGANGDVKEIGGSIKTIKEEVPAYEDDEFGECTEVKQLHKCVLVNGLYGPPCW